MTQDARWSLGNGFAYMPTQTTDSNNGKLKFWLNFEYIQENCYLSINIFLRNKSIKFLTAGCEIPTSSPPSLIFFSFPYTSCRMSIVGIPKARKLASTLASPDGARRIKEVLHDPLGAGSVSPDPKDAVSVSPDLETAGCRPRTQAPSRPTP